MSILLPCDRPGSALSPRRTAPVSPETPLCESDRCGRAFLLLIVSCLEFYGWDVPDGLKEASIVKPVDPFERCKLDLFDVPPWTASTNDFRLVETVDRLGQRVVVGIANTSHRRLNARSIESFGVIDTACPDRCDE